MSEVRNENEVGINKQGLALLTLLMGMFLGACSVLTYLFAFGGVAWFFHWGS